MRDKVVVITGAGGALGSAVARVAEERGAKVARLDLGKLDGALAYVGVDLGDFAAVERAMNDIKAKAGTIDALLNIAGGFRWQTLAEGDLGVWDKMFALNVKTAAHACRAALPHLIAAKGHIVNVGALGAVKAGAGMGAYAASKQGVMKLTESLAEELKGKVTVNAILPSIIDTAANRKDMPDADFSKWVTLVELANVMLFLASDEASAITGALIPVTGRV
jgi:NAD(P)-dependent dehydrogenase (short-subunit alcohol dehydrogenase family)